MITSSTQRQALARVAEAFGHRLVRDAPDPSPAIQLRALLAADRQNGRPFHESWDLEVELVLTSLSGRSRDEWRAAFAWAQADFRRAYERVDDPVPGMRLDASVLA